MQSERGLQNGLGRDLSHRKQNRRDHPSPHAEKPSHAGRLAGFRAVGKAGSLRRRGSLLLEAAISLSLLAIAGIVLLKLTLNILTPRQWLLQQTLSDAYLTYERAYAERIPFDSLLAGDSPWPAYPATSTATVVIGRMPGGNVLNGRVVRTRVADAGNYPIDGGTGTVATNPAAMRIWKVQSVMTYTVGKNTYTKSRTIIRSQ